MSKRRVIEDSDSDSEGEANAARSVGGQTEEVLLSPMSNSSESSTETSTVAVVDLASDSWFEKRDTTTMSAEEKRRNIDVARGQLKKKRRLVLAKGSSSLPAAPSPTLIKSRHTTRVYDSPTTSAGVADYDLAMALLNDTPENTVRKNKERGLARLAKSNLSKTDERSKRIKQRESGSRANPYSLDDKNDKKKKKKRDDSDEDGDDYVHFGGDDDDDDDDDGKNEEARRAKVLEMKSREVINRCTDLSVILRKALRSWQRPGQDGQEEEDGTCVNLSSIHSNTTSGVDVIGGEDGTHLLGPADLERVCPNLVLKDYQLVGINWLKLLHQNEVNGVLADDMGLGKTVQTIAFLAWLFACREDPERLREQVQRAHQEEEADEEEDEVIDIDDEESGGEFASPSPRRGLSPARTETKANPHLLPHLIVVPASTLANWCKEFEKFCPTLKVMRFHGSPLDKEDMKQQLRRAFLPKYQPAGGIPEDERVDVVITTYTMFERDSGAEDRSFLKKIPFEYLVLDEAHCIKNSVSSRYQNLRGLSPRRRLLLSGTPVQNDVRELLALLSFLMPRVFKMEYIDYLYDSFMDRFIDTSKKEDAARNATKKRAGAVTIQNRDSVTDEQKAQEEKEKQEQNKKEEHNASASSLHELRCMLAPFVLRRLKSDVLRQMPPKIDVPIKLQMTDRQASLYEDIINKHLLLKAQPAVAPTTTTTILNSSRSRSKSKSSSNNTDVPPTLNLSSSEASNIFTDLRKASNHPLLLRTHFNCEEVLHRIAAVCCSVQHFGETCDHQRAYRELLTFSDFDLNYLCLEYPSFLASLQLPSEVLYDSPKMVRLKTLLPTLIADGHRILIFSQWTKMMDIIGALLGDLQLSFLRLDGSTPVKERQRLIDEFETHVDIPIFVLSTRAGGLGINLTAADTVILHDLDFNPENDRQAEDRCHRIGQQKEVSIYRLITEDSVDENIFDMGERKKRLSKAVLADGQGEAGGEGVGTSTSKDTSEINRMLQEALLKTMKKQEQQQLTA